MGPITDMGYDNPQGWTRQQRKDYERLYGGDDEVCAHCERPLDGDWNGEDDPPLCQSCHADTLDEARDRAKGGVS